MQTIISKLVAVLGGLTLLLAAYLGGVVDSKDTVLGSAPAGLYATIATSSAYTVSTTPLLLFSNGTSSAVALANSNCASRVISTTASPIMISFGDRSSQSSDNLRNHATSTVSGILGHYQAASTTVAYDGAIYGCGEIAVYSFATGPITVSEFK